MNQLVQKYDTPPPNYNTKKHSTHGLSGKPSLPQLLSYFIIALAISVYFSCIWSIYQNIPLLVLLSVSLAVFIIFSVKATLCDPTDRVIYYYKWSLFDKKIAFKPDYKQILYCQHCDGYCLANSKHCRSCNRCVDIFDHHCMWFNNCVGHRNYKDFVIAITATFTFCLVFIIHCIMASIQTDFSIKEQLIKIIISWFSSLLLLIFGVLLFNLIVLHIYLNWKGLSTYQFIQQQKIEDSEKQKIEKLKIQQESKQNMIQESKENMTNALMSDIIKVNSKNQEFVKQQVEEVVPADTVVIQVSQEKPRQISEEENIKAKRQKIRSRKTSLQLQIKPIVYRKNKQKQTGDDDVTFAKEESEGYQSQNNEEMKQKEKVPYFLRNNRGLKLIMYENEAMSPSKRNLNKIDCIHE